MENPKSQTPETARLARKIRRARERKKMSWKNTCVTLNILKDNGSPDTGLAYKIGYNNFEPSGRPVRHRLGLRDICTKCRRAFRVPKVSAPQVKSAARIWWDSLKASERDKLIEISHKNYLKWKQSHEA